jgi:FkbH-like protein
VTSRSLSEPRREPACWAVRLSAEQLRFYFLHQLNPADPDIYICRTLRVTGPLDVELLRAAVCDLAARHDVLRSYYPEVDGRPQIRLCDDVASAFRVAPDASDAPDEPFAIDQGPLFRVTVIPTSASEHVTEHVIELRFHHIIVDGASVRVFVRGLFDAYRALGQGRRLERPAHQYRDYIEWEATRAVDRAYWASKLERPVVLDLATGTPRPDRHTRAAGTVHAVGSPQLVAALRAACKTHRVTPYLVMMAVFQILLHRVTGKDDILVATPIAARPRLDFQAMLGVLVSWVAFRARLGPEMTFRDVLAQVRADAPDALSRNAPYEALLAAAGSLPRDPARNPLFQVTLNYATLGELLAPAGLALALDPIMSRATPYDLAARFEEVGDTLRLELTYYEGALDRAAATRLADALLALAEHCLAAPDAALGAPARRVVIAATFTAEQLRPALAYWLALVNLRAELVIAPIDQVFQTVLATGAATPLVLLLRADDWKDPLAGVAELRRLVAARGGELIIVVCPSRVEDPRFAAELASVRAQVVPWQAIARRYPVAAIHDALADAEARAPYTEDFDTALATTIARALHAALRPAPKLLVLDCDNTLWRGVVGEDGVAGVVVDAGRRALQDAAVAQREAGVLLALASKNNEAEVWEAFDQVPGMVLRRDMIAAHRINWEPKSRSLPALAAELGLGLDSFVFIDDSPAECAEIRAACPGVTVLQLPADGIADFLAHLWPLDPRKLTDTDRKRAELYVANAQREQLRSASADLHAFVASLEVRTTFVAFSPGTAPRAAQLTQRTNQFHTTALRRSEAELEALVAGGAQLLIADVSDRFGDYGIVGVAIYHVAADALLVDSFLLSCRALGRGVEQRMLVELGRIAERAGVGAIELAYRSTSRNRPAFLFLEAQAVPVTPERYRVAVTGALAAGAKLVPAEPVRDDAPAPAVELEVAPAVWQRIASELSSVPKIRAAIAATRAWPRTAPGAYVAPGDELEARIAAVWAEVIGVEVVGATDDYFALGGDSIRSLAVVSRLRKAGLPASVHDLHQHPTVTQLAGALRSRTAPAPVAHPAPHASGPYPLSFSQAFVIHAYAEGNLRAGRAPSGAFHVQDRLTVRDPRGHAVDAVDALRRAVELLVHRTPPLRTRIFHDGARWMQVETAAKPTLATIDLAGLSPDAQEVRIRALLRDDRMRPFDPEHGTAPMIRFHALVRSRAELELIVAAHHGFCDGWSLHNFYNQLFALYEAYRADDRERVAAIDGALARHEHAFRELVAREQDASAHAAFWRGYLASRLDAPGPAVPSTATPGGYQPQLVATLAPALVERASARVAASRTSLKAVLLEAFAAALARGRAAREPLVIATVTNGRQDDLAAPTDVFGLCWTFVPIVCAPGERTARLDRLHRDLAATEAHARYPVEAMFDGVDAVASFNYAHFHNARWQRPDGGVDGVTVARAGSFHRFHFPLNVNVRRDDGLVVTVSWSEDVHDRRFARELLEAFTAELATELP